MAALPSAAESWRSSAWGQESELSHMPTAAIDLLADRGSSSHLEGLHEPGSLVPEAAREELSEQPSDVVHLVLDTSRPHWPYSLAILLGGCVMETEHRGGCLCGAVRFNVVGEPTRVGVCHCRYCQLRTGSAFGVGVYFPRDKFEFLSGDLSSYDMTTENGNIARIKFCAQCGTSVCWELDASRSAGQLGVSGGCFDPPTFWFDIDREVFRRSKAKFCMIDAKETFETHPNFAPKFQAEPRFDGST